MTAPRTLTQIQRQDRVGAAEAIHRQAAERLAYVRAMEEDPAKLAAHLAERVATLEAGR